MGRRRSRCRAGLRRHFAACPARMQAVRRAPPKANRRRGAPAGRSAAKCGRIRHRPPAPPMPPPRVELIAPDDARIAALLDRLTPESAQSVFLSRPWLEACLATWPGPRRGIASPRSHWMTYDRHRRRPATRPATRPVTRPVTCPVTRPVTCPAMHPSPWPCSAPARCAGIGG